MGKFSATDGFLANVSHCLDLNCLRLQIRASCRNELGMHPDSLLICRNLRRTDILLQVWGSTFMSANLGPNFNDSKRRIANP